MSNDNRSTILAQQSIDSAQARSDMCRMIGLLEAKVERLEVANEELNAELASMTAQRDAWKVTAMALEQTPERLETVELTVEQAVVLELLATNRFFVAGAYTERNAKCISVLLASQYIHCAGQLPPLWHITPAGRAALAAYRASCESETDA